MKWAAIIPGFAVMLGASLFAPATLPAAPPEGSAQSLPEPLPPAAGPSQPDDDLRSLPEAVEGRPTERNLSGNVANLLVGNVAPINLDAALRLAGVENPQIRIAAQRIAEAVAGRQLAAAQILPSLNGGTSYDNHTGNLQQVDGSMLSVNRSSLYAGAGALAVGSGTVQIPGVLWNLNVSQTAFNYLQSRQAVAQQQFATLATRNDMLLRVTVAYLELLRAEELRLIAMGIRDDAREVARVTANYAASGQGRRADANRAATELRQRQSEVLRLEAEVLVVAARLAALLNLNPSVRLQPTDQWVVPEAIVAAEISLPQLIATAIMGRPELAERQAAIRRALLDLNAAKLLPFSPTLLAGFSAGTFGGGSNLVTPTFGDFANRTDLDAVAYWTLQNLAVGNNALIRGASARLNTTNFQQLAVLNQVRNEVAAAHARSQARFAQIAITEEAVQASQEAFREDLNRVRALEGLPIEVLNSLQLLARARAEYLSSIVDFNISQFELYVALGQPPAASIALPVNALPPQADPAKAADVAP
jgi:outer membrane protein TolC